MSLSISAFLLISGAFSAAGGTVAGGTAAGGRSAVAEGDGKKGELDVAANVGIEGSIGLDAEGSLNVKFSTAAYN